MDTALADSLRQEFPDDPPPDPIAWACDGMTPRAEQEEILEFIDRSEKQFVMVGAPTGVGKSPVCMSVAQSQGGVVLTPFKMLQDQYTRDWPNVPVVKGAANYTCPDIFELTGGEASDCGSGGRLCKTRRTGGCPYDRAAFAVIRSTAGIANYAWLLAFVDVREWEGRHRWLIMDEGHRLERSLIDASTIDLGDEDCEFLRLKPPDPSSMEAARPGLEAYLKAACAKHAEMESVFNEPGGRLSAPNLKRMKILARHIALLRFIMVDAYRPDGAPEPEDDGMGGLGEDPVDAPNQWVVYRPDQVGDALRNTTFRPLYARGVFDRIIRPLGMRVLVTSATLVNPPAMAACLGWEPGEYDHLDVGSPFPVGHRPIIYRPVARLNRDNLADNLPAVVAEIDAILDDAAGRKAIIHSHSFQIAEEIRRLTRHGHRMVMHRRGTPAGSAIAAHAAGRDDGVLLSPSMAEGVDLPGKCGRVAIFPKMPYPYLGDPWVRARAASDPGWYDMQVATALIQGSGRIVRHRKDWGFTYILDGAFGPFFDKVRPTLPRWWVEAVRQEPVVTAG